MDNDKITVTETYLSATSDGNTTEQKKWVHAMSSTTKPQCGGHL
ncbi:hypothetical protein [Flagellimonas ochracea]|nr:hypothetical protein [Allomuricauda ochracea]